MISTVDHLSLFIAANSADQSMWAVWSPIGLSFAALVVSVIAAWFTQKGNRIAIEANQIAKRALELEESRQPSPQISVKVRPFFFQDRSGVNWNFKSEILNAGNITICVSKIDYRMIFSTESTPFLASESLTLTLDPQVSGTVQVGSPQVPEGTEWSVEMIIQTISHGAWTCSYSQADDFRNVIRCMPCNVEFTSQ